ncbi:uncharacterized protein OCT59_006957 [Rhizophagus irregularis]|uniref:uncharacterized protein n=1 Tax=Rhizophagus irregularis TaxID=588596 RepID=UPI00332ABE75|nr:hypothetical protein OCT59_006957 [Rhizophagus irregularis]
MTAALFSYNFRDTITFDTIFIIFTPIQVRTPDFDYSLPAFWTHDVDFGECIIKFLWTMLNGSLDNVELSN